ncbi:immunoglobulin-like domain-containing protein [Hymenobacter properus]|uniref:DUF5011 domain-containing protein n=1 Tax=Hymenobacter properus TaxID=2791026 RepID=A0A931BGN7_9BACT|nr:immunoglobulin-like domain-containing protein [Hymenobacter properus]MBF9141296.1 DUF5011 domain-containing protein [Hymenobacter properus]MBR7720106.1 DUF5011 domain-containing protein [Microvirga sp. SRT04]
MRKLALTLLGTAAVASSLALGGCKKTETDELSRIKNFPAITLAGNEYYVINVGETFTEPGVTAELGGAPLQPIISNPVNTSRPGIYVIRYKGANTEGDTIAATRTVIVTDPAVNNLDQSGTFTRSGFSPSPVTKVGNKGLYRIDNFGFTNAPNLFTAYFVQTDASHIVVPAQTIPGLGYTTFTSVSGTFTAGQLTRIAYAINAPAIFGNTVRAATR